MDSSWQAYIIYHPPTGATYVGVSPDPVRRLRAHNGEISGGAKYTTSKGPGWKHVCLIKGFPTSQNSLQFEWAVKHVPPKNAGGIKNRLNKLGIVLCKERWTSKSPKADLIPLEVVWTLDTKKEFNIDNPFISSQQIPEYITQHNEWQ